LSSTARNEAACLTHTTCLATRHPVRPGHHPGGSGEIDRTELSTVRSYIEVLGGRLKVVAAFGDERQVIA